MKCRWAGEAANVLRFSGRQLEDQTITNPGDDENQELQDELCYGLNETERRTWLKIINGQPLQDIAKDEGVKRSAIYSRVRGSRKSKGMIRKNFYVARWWELRQRGELYH